MSRRALLVMMVVYLALGVSAGLLGGWAWQVAPAGCEIEEMSDPFLDEYVLALAAAYRGSGQAAPVRRALPGLSDAEIGELAESSVDRMMLESSLSAAELAAVASLAARFGRVRPDLLIYAASPQLSPVETEVVAGAVSTRPTSGRGLAPGFRFVATRLQGICSGSGDHHRVEVWVEDQAGRPLPGEHLRLYSEKGAEDAYTGLKRLDSPGYADFRLEEEIMYRLVLLDEKGREASEDVALSVPDADCGPYRNVTWVVRFARVGPE